MKIYTKTGDSGETSLYGGERRQKSDLRIVAYGEVDELQAALGIVVSLLAVESSLTEVLRAVQSDCFTLSTELARTETKASRKDPVLAEARVAWLEAHIDTWQQTLPELQNFILPGGSPAGAHLHLARTICRRAERGVVALAHQETLRPLLAQYLNRLSDALFVMARVANQDAGVAEQIWKNP